METVEQVNEDFNVKKPKKKGLIIGGIIAAVIIVALVLVYFLVLNNPKFIFSKAIDKVFAVDSESYDSIKMATEIKASVELEDTTYQAQLAEVEKYTLKAGVQMDAQEKQEIVDLGLEYDNQAVIDAQVYYNDGEMYAYFDEIFDKYIQLDMDEETKAQLDEIFESATSEKNLKNTEKAIEIMKDELKAQIKENGEFEKKKDTIEVGEDEVKVTKSTVTITEKQLYKIAENMLSNLAKNDEFIDCFEESPKDLLKEAADEIKNLEGNSKNNLKISLYTKGLLNNKIVAVDVEIYSVDDASTIVASVVKEDEDVYTYNVSMKASGVKADLVKGKVKIQKYEDSKEEQSGKAIITAEVIETGSAKIEIDYSVEYNKGIDKIDVEDSINMNELTETDMQSIMTKLMERPIIGQLIQNEMSGMETETEDSIIDGTDTTIENNNLTTTQNEVKDEDYGYSVTYSVPTGFEYEGDYSYDYNKYYELEENDAYIDATVSLEWYTEAEYVEEEIKWDYDYYTETTEYYKNVNLSEVKTVVVGDKTFKYVVLAYESNSEYYEETYQDVYVWYTLGDEHIFTVKLEATDKEITEDIIKGFLNINVTELN